MVYARTFDDGDLTFDFGAGLVEDNLLLVDRETNSVWSQLAGKAVSGPMRDAPLRQVPSLQTTWGFWRKLHPDTRVMIIPGQEGRPYLYRDRTARAPVSERPPQEHDISALGLGLVVEGEEWFFPLSELERAGAEETPLELGIGGRQVTIHYRAEGLAAWSEDAEGELLPAVLVYAGGWQSFFPESQVFKAQAE